MSFAPLAAAFVLGLASAPHCMGMCGPLASACMGRTEASALYHLARATTYVALGALASLALGPLRERLPADRVAWVLGAITAGTLAFSAFRLFRAPAAPAAIVPATSLVRRDGKGGALLPLGLGALTGLLPCGSLYGALVLASTAERPVIGALSMAVFALTTAVPLSFSQLAARALLRDANGAGRRIVAGVLVAGAVLALVRPLSHPGEGTSCHAPSATETAR